MSAQECHSLIDLFAEEAGCHTINQFLTKLLFLRRDDELFTNTALQSLNNRINNANTTKTTSKTSMSAYTGITHPTKSNVSPSTKHTKLHTTRLTLSRTNRMVFGLGCSTTNAFPLIQLPVEMIRATTMCLKEPEILSFEKVCRLFYQLVNNFSFLSKYNGFNEITLNNKHFSDIITNITTMDLFKYSKCKHLILSSTLSASITSAKVNHFETILLLSMLNQYYSNWLVDLFRSITKLSVFDEGFIYLPSLPLNILFDKDKSNLNEIYFDFDSDYLTCNSWMSRFDAIYAHQFELTSPFQSRGNINYNHDHNNNIITTRNNGSISTTDLHPRLISMNANEAKLIKLVKTSDLSLVGCASRVLNMSHLWLEADSVAVEWGGNVHYVQQPSVAVDYFKSFCKYHPNLTTLTMDGFAKIEGINCNADAGNVNLSNTLNGDMSTFDDVSTSIRNVNIFSKDSVESITRCKIKSGINTLRMINLNFRSAFESILNDKNNIFAMNLHNTLKNITLHIKSNPDHYTSGRMQMIKLCFDNMINQRYFTNLQNINFLFEFTAKELLCGLSTRSQREKAKCISPFIRRLFESVLANMKRTLQCTSLKSVNVGIKVCQNPLSPRSRSVGHIISWQNGTNENVNVSFGGKKFREYVIIWEKLFDVDNPTYGIEFREAAVRFDQLIAARC